MRQIRRFTPDEDAKIERLRIDGASLREIAERIGRGKSAVQMRLVSLAIRAEREDSDV